MHTYVRTLYESTASQVFLCRCRATGRYIVLKASTYNDQGMIESLRQNPHRNIVEYQDPMDSHIAMDYYPRGDLFSYVEQNHQNMTSNMIQRMISELSQALSHIHGLGIAHFDISLENVFLDDNLSCRLTDFQLAKTSASNINGVVGKLIYMAPEVLNNRSSYDGYQADIWSFGIVCFILMTGNPLCEVASRDNANFQRFSQL